MPAVRQLLDAAVARLHGSDSPRLDAEVLLAHVLGKSRTWLLAWPEREIDAQPAGRFATLIAQRAAGKPVAHLTGQREFWSLELAVDDTTLIPRPETELLVERALAWIPDAAQGLVADLGTGSGAVALAIASERPGCFVLATDIHCASLQLARRNAARLAVRNIGLVCGDWLAPLAARSLDLVVSNPPYVADADPHLEHGDVRFEPRRALTAGADGLDAIRVIAQAAGDALKPGGRLLLEHGPDQAGAVRSLLRGAGFTDLSTFADLGGRPRVTEARLDPQGNPVRAQVRR